MDLIRELIVFLLNRMNIGDFNSNETFFLQMGFAICIKK